jgi:hypothetical protein
VQRERIVDQDQKQKSRQKVIGLVFGQGSARTASRNDFGGRVGSAGMESQRCVAKKSLKGLAAGEVNANATGGLADAGTDFEKLGAQSFDLR